MIYSDTFFIILLVDLFLISLLRGVYWKFTKQLLFGVFVQRYANRYLREENVFTERVTLLITIVMLINFSLLISKGIFGLELTPAEFFVVFILVTAYFLLKAGLILLFGHILLLNSLSKLTIYFSFLFDRTLSIILFPFIVIMFFSRFNSESNIYLISCVIIVCFVLIKIYWILKIGIDNFGLSKYYLFLYLCTLEILPFLLIGKQLSF